MSPEADQAEAELETVLSPLAGIEDNERNIRITAAVPDVDAGHLRIDVLKDSIVVEGVSATPIPG
jgi:HSP20 family molecular chaperone IbpA